VRSIKSACAMLSNRRKRVDELKEEIKHRDKIIYMQQMRLNKMLDIVKNPKEYLKNV